MTAAFLAAMILSTAPAPSSGADWPQWRGVNRDGKSAEKGIVIPSSGPPLAWKNENIGLGYGQPVVIGNRLYVLGGAEMKPDGAEYLQCLNLDDGKEIWKTNLGTSAGSYSCYGCGPRSAPTFADGHFYCLGGVGDLVCFKDDGKKVWSKNLVKDFGGQIPVWGYAESPLVDGDRVIVSPGAAAGMVCLEAKTGKTIWQCKDLKDGSGYSSAMIMKIGDRKLYVRQMMNLNKEMRTPYPEGAVGVDAKDGKIAFKVGSIGRSIAAIPTPIISGEYVFFTAGYNAGCEAFKVTASGKDIKAESVFNGKQLDNHHGGVIEHEDHIFGHGAAKGWTCMTFKDANPKIAWNNTDFFKGSISYADGHFFCYSEANGDLAIIKASTAKWDQVAKMKLPATSAKRPNNGKVWPHPVIAQGKLFLRDYEMLFAFDLKSGK